MKIVEGKYGEGISSGGLKKLGLEKSPKLNSSESKELAIMRAKSKALNPKKK